MYTAQKSQLQSLVAPACANQATKTKNISCRVLAQKQESQVERRQALLSGIASAVTLANISQAPSLAKYGDAANVFGRITNKSGYVPYVGEGFSILIPGRWGPSKEKEFKNVQLRYEDTYDYETNFIIIKEKTDKSSIEEYGSPEQYLKTLGELFGRTTFKGETQSEGGFKPNQVAAASLLNQEVIKDKNGKTYYKYEFLIRTADGNEGGTHLLIGSTVNNGEKFIIRAASGDKRWMRGYRKEVVTCFDSFTVA